MIPKPFGKIVVTIGKAITLSGDGVNDDSLLEKELSKRNYCMLENIYFFETNSQYFNLILN